MILTRQPHNLEKQNMKFWMIICMLRRDNLRKAWGSDSCSQVMSMYSYWLFRAESRHTDNQQCSLKNTWCKTYMLVFIHDKLTTRFGSLYIYMSRPLWWLWGWWKEFLREPGQFRSSVDFFSGWRHGAEAAPPPLSSGREQDKKIKGSDGNVGDEEDAIHMFLFTLYKQRRQHNVCRIYT